MERLLIARQLAGLLKPRSWALPVLVVLGVVASVLEGVGIYLFIPLLQFLVKAPTRAESGNQVVDTLIQFGLSLPEDWRLAILALCIVISITLKNIVSYANVVGFYYLNAHASDKLRSEIFDRILHLDFRQIDKNQYGSLVNTLGTSTWRTSDALSILARIVANGCTCVVFIALLLLLWWQLTLLTLFFVCLISLVALWLTRGVKALGHRAVEANGELADRMWEAFGGLRVIRAFGREAYEKSRYDEASHHVRDTFFKLEVLSALAVPLSEVLAVALVAGLVLWFGRDTTTLAALIAFLVLLYRLLPKARELTAAQVGLNALASAVEDATALLNQCKPPHLRSGPVRVDRLQHGISLDRVSFSYALNDQPAIDDVSFEIRRGTTTAIVGPSGAGKSTLINLLCRFYDIDSGEIWVDGTSLQQLDLAEWRSRIGLIGQDVHLFNATVRENIAYGRLDANDAEIVRAARLANAHGFVEELAQGYATPVGGRGVRLSGGQRQRIALARAIIRDPDILILDEATNALDSLAEDLIQTALEQFSCDRTVIIIAHRLSTIERADHIIVLERGRVVEQGDMAALIRGDHLFARLHRLQNRPWAQKSG
jgi:ATP-binding cassette, subfamily B, bacterial MsbA